MKKRIGLFIFILFILCNIIYLSSRHHVITNKEIKYYISTTGSDDFDGSLPSKSLIKRGGPFKTIDKAKSVVRADLAKGIYADIKIIFRQGEYSINSPIQFDSKDCNINGYKVVYEAFPNEEVIISTGNKLEKWKHVNGHIYKTYVGSNNFKSLYENGQRAVIARNPNDSYEKVVSFKKANSKLEFGFSSKDISKMSNIKELEIGIWAGGIGGEWSWYFDQRKIENINMEDNTITLDKAATYELGVGSRYYIQGAFEFVDSKGEFYLDRESGYLYYWPYNEPINDQSIMCPSADNIINLGDEENRYVSNITFDGLSFCNTDVLNEIKENGIIRLGNNCKKIIIKNCRIYNSGNHGILLSRWSQDNLIYGNEIYNIGYSGINLDSDVFDGYINRNNSIVNNYIHNVGQLIRHGNGIFISNSGENYVANNKIQGVPRDGIKMVSSSPSLIIGEKILGQLVTKENVKEFAFCKNNTIEYNDITNAVNDSQDAGIIGCWEVGTGNIINNNYLHDSDVPFSFASGIYIDDGSNDVIIKNNVLERLQKENKNGLLLGAIYVKGVNNKVINNLIVNNQESGININTYEMANEPNNSIYIKNNIFFNSGECLYNFVNWDNNRFEFCDYNIIYNSLGNLKVFGVPGVNSFNDWKKIFTGRYDQGSLLENPKFVDEIHGDYRLMYNSSAYLLGIKDIDFENIGLLENFKFPNNKETIEKLFIKEERSDNKSYLQMTIGDTVNLSISARTSTGFKKNINNKDIILTTDNNTVSINKNNQITAESKGVCRITANLGGSKINSLFYLIIK